MQRGDFGVEEFLGKREHPAFEKKGKNKVSNFFMLSTQLVISSP